MSARPSLVDAAAALILAAGLGCLVTVEWSYPYCSQPSDGPAFPAVGFPFPYAIASHVSSLEFLFMPHGLAVNLLLTAAALFPAVRLTRRALPRALAWRRVAVAILVVLGTGVLALCGASLALGQPVASIGDGAFLAYGDLRPVGITSGQVVHTKRTCTGSPFWFPRRGE